MHYGERYNRLQNQIETVSKGHLLIRLPDYIFYVIILTQTIRVKSN